MVESFSKGKSNKDLEIVSSGDLLHTSTNLENREAANAAEGLADMLHAAAYSGLQKPVEGLVQLAAHATNSDFKAPQVVSKLDHENNWTMAGSMAGAVGDFYLLSKTVGLGREKLLSRATTVPLLEAGTTGALYEIAMPTNDRDYVFNKLKNAAVGFGTFATMDGAANKLKAAGIARDSTILGNIKMGGYSGMAGGFAHSVLDKGLSGEVPNYYDVGTDMAQYGIFGMGFGGVEGSVQAGFRGYKNTVARFQERAANGDPVFSLGPFEMHPRGYAERARDAAFTDGLTGLKNKAYGDQALHTEVTRAQREGEPLSMTFLDLDNFKAVNDKIGHQHGDAVLKEVAGQMQSHFSRGTDVHIREGGDEFMVLMPNTELANASELASGFEARMRISASKEPVDAARLAKNFPRELDRIRMLDRTISTSEGETLQDIAKQLMETRQSITGEQITEKTLAAEVKRLSERTGLPENASLKTGELTVYSDSDFMALGEKTAFRFTPQIGQLIKMRGLVTEPQLQELLDAQALAPAGKKPLIGDLLVNNGYATREQVEAIFQEQNQIRSNLRDKANEILNPTNLVPHLNAQFPLPNGFSSPAQIVSFRSLIPEVPRPMLSPNGVRPLALYEKPVTGEVVVGVSSGVVELAAAEDAAAFKSRGDHLMYDKKLLRKQQGLRYDRNEGPTELVGDPAIVPLN